MKKPYFSLRQRLQKVSWFQKFIKSPVFIGLLAVGIPVGAVYFLVLGAWLNRNFWTIFPAAIVTNDLVILAIQGIAWWLLAILIVGTFSGTLFISGMVGWGASQKIREWLNKQPLLEETNTTPPPKRLTVKQAPDNLPRFG